MILYLAGSNSKKSINKELCKHTVSNITEMKNDEISLQNLNIPIFGVDIEEVNGIPVRVKEICNLIAHSNGLIISLAEHNSNFTVEFKNLFDWCSRVDRKFLSNKPILLLSTSPGPRGGSAVMKLGLDIFPRFGGNIVTHFSLPSFYENYDIKRGITDDKLKTEFQKTIEKFKSKLYSEE